MGFRVQGLMLKLKAPKWMYEKFPFYCFYQIIGTTNLIAHYNKFYFQLPFVVGSSIDPIATKASKSTPSFFKFKP